MATIHISREALGRLPAYRQYLKKLFEEGVPFVTATAIAAALRLNEIQVRKDISAVSSRPGKPMVGFSVEELLRDINGFLAYDNVRDAVIVGAGVLGRALMNHTGFVECGMNIVAAFDSDPALAGAVFGGKTVYPMDELLHIVRRLNILIGIITVPAEAAQAVCDRLMEGGILAVWNFAPIFLRTPKHILVQNAIMASSLAELTCRMNGRETEDAK